MSGGGYGMIYASIFDSSVAKDWQAMVVFIALIALADKEDNVFTDPWRLARKTNMPESIVFKGLMILLEEDPLSFNKAENGRRITFLPLVGTDNPPSLEGQCRGFHVVNRAYYKRLLRKKYNAQYNADRRAAKYSSPENLYQNGAKEALEDFRSE
jgi:hypothetical protein